MWQSIKNVYHGILALLAAVYNGFPGKRLQVVGITGTDGKTTTTHLIHHILKTAGEKAAMVSSVYAEISGKKYDTGFHVTTPDPWQLQGFLRQAVDQGDEYMVLEVTSHGLDQNRVSGINFKLGVITNASHEHLDYHKTYFSYLRTKEKLLKRAGVVVVNIDDESYQHFDFSNNRSITYGMSKKADITPKTFPFTTPLPGEYNRYNCLAAIAACRELGIADEIIRSALKTFAGVKGRFEYFPTRKNFDVIIDFAHTPNAFKKVLSTLNPEVHGKLIHVFGSAGLRDRTKRPLMGKISAKYANFIVLTEEDSRTESVGEINRQIAQGCLAEGAVEYEADQYQGALKEKKVVFFQIPDRKTAIEFAIMKLCNKGDTLILTGKAHEKSLCRGTIEYPWSEHEAVKKALRAGKNS